MEKVVLSWSGGKDSALALYEIQRSHQYSVVSLLTTITRDYSRISMHGVREILLERQVESAELPLRKVYIPANCTNEIYADIMEKEMNLLKGENICTVAFGDIFLQDVRDYRENNLRKIGMKAVFPLWSKNSGEIVTSFINLGFKAVVTTVDPRKLSPDFCGRIIDRQFLKDLPEKVDPAGENGEFHSFVFEGPIFKSPIRFSIGERVMRDSFYFCDLLPIG
ncbi:MAG: ATP-binding protein [Chloroflexi bacterium RBG_13_46_9]|nr:MAG: ATP-binding protein [Chloroflexi bacterium RBG_13_46_9]